MNGNIYPCILLAKAAHGYLRHLGTAESLGDIRVLAPHAHAIVFDEAVPSDDDPHAVRVVANSPVEWLLQLEAAGATDAWVVHGEADRPSVPGRIAAAFANGSGVWGVRVTTGTRADIWLVRLIYAPLEDPYRPAWWRRFLFPTSSARACRPWRVTFTSLPTEGPASQRPRPDIEGCSTRLRSALVRNRDFAEEWKLKPWGEWFSRALAELDGKPFAPPQPAEVGPPGIYDPPAERLLRAAGLAWCFGGMGTWNDIWVKKEDAQQLQESIAGELYDAVIDAYQQATWPTDDVR